VNPSRIDADAIIIKIIKSSTSDVTIIRIGFAFRGWNYAYILVRLTPIIKEDKEENEVYTNIGYSVTLADKS